MKSKSGVLKKIGIGLICISLLGSSVNISALANEKSVADSKFSEGLAVEQPKEEITETTEVQPEEEIKEVTEEKPEEEATEVTEVTEEKPEEEATEVTEVTEEKPEEEATEVTEVTEEKPEEEAKEVTEVTEEKPEEEAKEVTEVTEEKPEEEAKEVTEVTEEKPEEEAKEVTEVTEEKPEEEAKETTEGQPKEDKEITEEEIEEVAFNETTCVGDVEISVTADEGVFPEGAVLKASEAKQAEENIAEDVIAELRDESVNVAKSYTFDIKVLNKDGEEIEPDTKKGEVSVSFKLKEAEDINLDTQIYHIEGDMSDSSSLSATELSVVPDADSTDSQVVTALTDGFSYYTVEFTYNSMEYVLEGDEKVELTTILDCVGLDYSAGIEAVKGSNDELFYPCEEDGIWYITAVTAFDTNEELSVTIGGIEYVIDVTDATYVASFTVNGTTTNYSTFAEAVSAANSTAGGVIKLLSDTSTSAFQFTKNTTLNLNGKTLTTIGVTNYAGKSAAVTVGTSSGTSVDVTIEGGGTLIMRGFSGSGCYGLTTVPGGVCHVEKDVYIRADIQNRTGIELRAVCAGDNSKIYFKDAKVEAVNAVNNETKLAILVAWNGEIIIDGGEYIWGNNHTDWSGVVDSVNNITIYDGKFNGRIWYSGNGKYKIYGGEFSQADIYTQSGSTVISKPWNEYILDAVVTDLGAGTVYRYKITVPKCNVKTEVNSESAGSASANPSSGRAGDKITITAKPKDGFKFVNWSGDGSGSTNPITRTIQSGDIDKTYTYKANFALAGTPSPTATNIKDTSMTVSWGAVTGATSYDLYVSTDSSCSSSFVSGYGPKSLTATSESLTGLNINSKYYYKVVAKAPDNLSTTSSVGNATTLKAASTVTVAPKAKNLVYSGTAMQLIEVGSAEGGTLKYSLDGSTYSTNIPTGVNAGDYTVYYKVFGDPNHNDTQPQTLSVTIAKADCTVTAPEVVDNLVYTGSPLGLVTEGSAVGGEMKYSLDGSTYSTDIPTGVNAGDYTVYYKVFGDPNHNDTQAQTLSVTIAKADCIVTAPEVIDNLVYTGSPLDLISAGSAEGGEMRYVVNDGSYTQTIPTGILAGDYTVNYVVVGDSNHNNTQPLATPLTVRIDKAARSPISTIAKSYTYDQTEPVVMPSVDVEPEEEAVVTYFYNAQNSKVGGTKWENVTATTLDAGTYYAYATAAETDNYYSFTTEPTEFTVNKGECAIIAPQAKSLEYMDEPIELVTAGSVKGGTLVYSIDNVEYSKDIPKATKVAEYTVYYKAIGDKNHNDSEVYSLNVSIGKGQRKDVLATVESYKYRQTEPLPTPGLTPKLKDSPKITYYYNTVQSNCDGTPWSELTAMTLKAGTYYIYAEIEATDSYQKYVTKPNEFVVLNCDKILITEEDVKVFIDGKDKVTEEIIDKYGYELHETKKDESGKVVTPGDFEKKITKVDNGDTIDYIIEYTFSGDYTGKVVKKITIAKQKDDPSDKSNDVIRSMVSKEKAAEYAPVVESMPKTAVKSLIVKDILDNKEIVEKQLSKTQFTTKDIVKHLEEANLDKISVISNVVIEVKEEKSSEVVPDDKEKIVKVAKELGAADKIGYLDISMFISYSVVNEKNQEILKMTHKKITDTQAKDLKEKFESTITIVVPPQMRLVPDGYEREYSVVRVHDGKAEVLAKSTEGKLTFQTSKFSTYALLYKDTQLPPKQDEPSGDDTQSVETQNFFSIPVENVSNIVTLNGFISPKTGDSNALFGWAALLLVGIALVLTGKKKDNGR